MSVFITVGSTGFDDLIQETTTQEFLTCLLELNIKRVVFQYGSSEPVFAKNIQSYEGPRIDIEGYRYKPSITKDILTSDIIISHAGMCVCVCVCEAYKTFLYLLLHIK